MSLYFSDMENVNDFNGLTPVQFFVEMALEAMAKGDEQETMKWCYSGIEKLSNPDEQNQLKKIIYMLL